MPSRKDTLADILSDKGNRETVLGVLEAIAPTRDTVERDTVRILNYSTTQDYSIFAKEAWSEILKSIDKLTGDNLTETQVHFYRGKLSSTLDLLRLSYLARNAKNRIDQEKKLDLTIN